jgi:deoxyribose-phosphate aldolase
MGNPPPPPAAPAQDGLPPELTDATRDDAALKRFLHGLPGVDQVGLEQRAAGLGTRSIKKASKLWAIDTAIRMVDLTTLEGADTEGKVRALAAKARRPDPDRPETPSVAAVCVYPDLASTAVNALTGTGVGVA